MESSGFINLHTHSFYSILESTLSPKDIVKLACEKGQKAIALTDSGSGYGLIDFYQEAKNASIKPILGVEIFVAKDSRFEKRQGIDGNEGYIVLLAKNMEGYENLLKLISLASLQGFYQKPRADWDSLEKHKEGLYCLTGSKGSLLERALIHEGNQAKIMEKLSSIYGENLFGEICAQEGADQKLLNEFVAKTFETQKLVVTHGARFANKEDEDAAKTLYCIGKNHNINDEEVDNFMKGAYFKDWEEMLPLIDYLDKSILDQAKKNTEILSDNIDLNIDFNKHLLPEFKVPSENTPTQELKEQCEEAISHFYPKKEEYQKIKERLDYELGVICKMGFESYFLIVSDFINFAKKNNIAVGPGRGSAAGSIVSYLLGITSIDPIAYDLLFERFLNPERISMPDIDIDFSDERRDEILQYALETYGSEKVSKVCTFGTLGAKASLKDVGRVHGIPFAQMNAMTKLLPNRPGFTLEDAKKIKDFSNFISGDPLLEKVFDLGQKLEGSVRHVSVHACAVIIGKEDLVNYTPMQWGPAGDADMKITQFPYQQLEHLGLLKMDFLGLKNLSVIEKALGNIQKYQQKELILQDIPIDDEKTFQMLSRGETTGVFQFESSGMRQYLKELKPTEIEDLVAMNALYRPGPMEYIPQYIKGKHHPKKVKYIHDDLKKILEKTYGIAVYQEQILKIAQIFAGFTLGEADILRKAIGKKIPEILEEQRQRFIDGAKSKNYDETLAIKIFDEIVDPFSGYGFNRSHAVCYARIAYETAYLRANYPVEFMAAMMTTDRSNTDRIVLEMNECQSMGIRVSPPHINISDSYFTILHKDKAQMSLNEDALSEICFGLAAIKGMGEESVRGIIEERNKNGHYESLQDFAKRVPLKLMNKKTLEALAFSGAFDIFGDRKAIVDSLDELAEFARDFQSKKEGGQMGLFGNTENESIEFSIKKSVAKKEDILYWERESLGIFVSDHPLKGLEGYLEKYGKLIGKLNENEDAGERRTLHGIVTKLKKIVTKKGQYMAILELEDVSGKIECAIFPQIYETLIKTSSSVFEEGAFLRIRGKVESRNGGLNCILNEAKKGNLEKVQNSAYLFTDDEDESTYKINIPENISREDIDEIKKILRSFASENDAGISVVVILKGKSQVIPFKINNREKLEQEINTILS